MPSSVVLSGTMFSGKTTAATLLAVEHGYVLVSARSVLRELAGEALHTREDLQRFGADLEARTNGRWLGVAAQAAERLGTLLVVDSARTLSQVRGAREALEHVEHIHLSVPLEVLRQRFGATQKDLIEPPSFDEAVAHEVEREAMGLGRYADLVIDAEFLDPPSIVARIVHHLSP